jgi:hypothetical protein
LSDSNRTRTKPAFTLRLRTPFKSVNTKSESPIQASYQTPFQRASTGACTR